MADRQSRENQVLNLLHSWLLDLACHKAFNELWAKKCVSNTDFIQGVLLLPQDNIDAKIQVHLLLLMCKLSNGEDYSTCYTANSDLTVLEEVLISFDHIIKSFGKESDIWKNSTKHRVMIMKQAVFVCCRAGDFEKAKSVFERQWSDFEDVGDFKAQRSALEAVIKSKNPEHEILKMHLFASFLDQTISFLKEIMNSLPEPFLIKVTKAYIDTREIKNDDESYQPRMKRCMNLQDFKKHGATKLNPREEVNLKQKLLRIQQKAMKDCVSRAQDTNNCNTGDVSDSNNMSCLDVDSPGEDSESRSHRTMNVAQKCRSATKNLKEKTENLRKTLERIKERSQEQDESSSPDKLLQRRTNRHTAQGTPQKFQESSGSVQERRLQKKAKFHKPGFSHVTIPDSTSKQRDRNQVVPDDFSDCLSVSDQESSDDASPDSPVKKLCLGPRPKVRRSLQLRSGPISKKKAKVSRCHKRFWTGKEEESFYLCVQSIGIGRWSEIRRKLKTTRSGGDLKDKWRQLIRSGNISQLEQKFGKV